MKICGCTLPVGPIKFNTIKLDKDEIGEIVTLKLKERANHFDFLNKEYLKILIDIIVDSIYESQGI